MRTADSAGSKLLIFAPGAVSADHRLAFGREPTEADRERLSVLYRQAAAACNVSQPVMRRWLFFRAAPAPWTIQQHREVREASLIPCRWSGCSVCSPPGEMPAVDRVGANSSLPSPSAFACDAITGHLIFVGRAAHSGDGSGPTLERSSSAGLADDADEVRPAPELIRCNFPRGLVSCCEGVPWK